MAIFYWKWGSVTPIHKIEALTGFIMTPVLFVDSKTFQSLQETLNEPVTQARSGCLAGTFLNVWRDSMNEIIFSFRCRPLREVYVGKLRGYSNRSTSARSSLRVTDGPTQEDKYWLANQSVFILFSLVNRKLKKRKKKAIRNLYHTYTSNSSLRCQNICFSFWKNKTYQELKLYFTPHLIFLWIKRI